MNHFLKLQDNDRISHNDNYSIEAETELLGILIQDNNKFYSINDFKEEYFYVDFHCYIFLAIKELIINNQKADVVTLQNFLKTSDIYKEYGDAYIIKLNQTLSYSTIKGRAELLQSLWLKRKLMLLCQNNFNEIADCSFLDIKEKLENMKNDFLKIDINKTEKSCYTIKELSLIQKDRLKSIASGKKNTITSGFIELDNQINGGFGLGNFITIGGATGLGKTSFALNIMHNVAKNFKNNDIEGNVVFFSLEMSADDIADKIASIHYEKSTRIFKTGMDKNKIKITDYEIEEISNNPIDLPIIIDDFREKRPSIEEINKAITILQFKKMKPKIIIIDYIQRISFKDGGNYVFEYEIIANELKSIAKKFNIPIIALSQVNREVNKTDTKKPTMSNIKSSSGIVEASDLVLLLHRDAYYLKQEKPEYMNTPIREIKESQESFLERQRHYAENKKKYDEWQIKYDLVKDKIKVIIAKNRHGNCEVIDLFFDEDTQIVSNFRFHKQNIEVENYYEQN